MLKLYEVSWNSLYFAYVHDLFDTCQTNYVVLKKILNK